MRWLRRMSGGRLNGLRRLGAAEEEQVVLSSAAQQQAQNVKQSPKQLQDSFGRQHTYLRISLTERCNLRCMYCMPEEGIELSPSEKLLTAAEIERVTRVFLSHGINKVRLTGGEPLVRKDFDYIMERMGALKRNPEYNLRNIAITTNGISLKRKLNDLVSAGLTAVNISLDTLVPAKFELITRRLGHERVLEAIDASLDANFGPVKINCVLMRGVNDDELIDFCRLTEKKNIDMRFIEYMPFDGNKWSNKKFVSYAEAMERITGEFGKVDKAFDERNDTSKHYRIPGFQGRIGFITSMSNHFCGTCNRLRLTADGNLKVCLFGSAEVSLRDIMRDGGTDEDLSEVIAAAVYKKHFALGGNQDMFEIASHKNRPMITIGG
mmetsp:Transcript_6819/g.20733  ORF Transcript_6819/g.20733 Transcript_6819/m.20733 type:complete len:379 (-) Transcript_6819:218-1354(-)